MVFPATELDNETLETFDHTMTSHWPHLVLSRCNCEAGWAGKNCDKEYRPCYPSPCHNGGVCTKTGRYQYDCSCPNGESCHLIIIYFPIKTYLRCQNCQNCQISRFVGFMSSKFLTSYSPQIMILFAIFQRKTNELWFLIIRVRNWVSFRRPKSP